MSAQDKRAGVEMSQNTGPRLRGLSQLPFEILELIGEQFANDYTWIAHHSGHTHPHGVLKQFREFSFESIKRLRLVSRRFSLLRCLKKILFRKIRLYAFPKYVDLLRSTRLDSIASYITYIEFSAFPFPPKMSQRELEDCILAGSTGSYTSEEIRKVYKGFHRLAEEGRWLLESQDVHELWISALKQLAAVEEVLIQSPLCVEQDMGQLKSLGITCNINRLLDSFYFGDDYYAMEEDEDMEVKPFSLKEEVAQTGNTLLAVAVHCMAKAGSSPSSLTIRTEHTADFHWERISDFELLDLGNVADLRYDSLCRDGGSYYRGKPSSQPTSSLQALLSRVSSSANSISLKNASRQAFTWHHSSLTAQPQIHFSSLRSFTLVDGYIDAYGFADFLAKQDLLEKLRLEDVWPDDYHRGVWKLIFFTVRRRFMLVEIVDSYVSREARERSGSTFSVTAVANARVSSAEILNCGFDDERSSKNFDKDLIAYIEGEIEWTSVLEDRFFRDDDVNIP